MNYSFTPIRQEISIDYLVSIHYFEYPHDFYFAGEAHDFWEFLYVDKGEVEVTGGASTYSLKQGDVIFHKPMEFHRICSAGAVSPTLIISSFVCNSSAMRFFEGKVLRTGEEEKKLLEMLIREGKSAYASPLNDPYLEKLVLRAQIPFAAEQMVRLSLELLLIQLIRRGEVADRDIRSVSSMRERGNEDLLARVTNYLTAHITENLTVDDICRDNMIGRSNLQKIFRAKTGGGIIEYFSRLKIEMAKQYIREGKMNFTEIARDLGFATIHYFSRRFKEITGMTPTEYASSVRTGERQKETGWPEIRRQARGKGSL